VKKNKLYPIVVLFLGILISCQEKKQETPVGVNSSSSPSQKGNFDNYSPIFQAIIKKETGMARGVSLGDIKETTLLSESQPENGKSYTEYFDNTDLNFADILYTKNEQGTVASIIIDVYIEKQSTVGGLLNEFKGYFNKKYGKGEESEKATQWELPDKENTLVLQNVSTQKDPGLKIIFAKTGDKALQ
jgi:hypothetical protein